MGSRIKLPAPGQIELSFVSTYQPVSSVVHVEVVPSEEMQWYTQERAGVICGYGNAKSPGNSFDFAVHRGAFAKKHRSFIKSHERKVKTAQGKLELEYDQVLIDFVIACKANKWKVPDDVKHLLTVTVDRGDTKPKEPQPVVEQGTKPRTVTERELIEVVCEMIRRNLYIDWANALAVAQEILPPIQGRRITEHSIRSPIKYRASKNRQYNFEDLEHIERHCRSLLNSQIRESSDLANNGQNGTQSCSQSQPKTLETLTASRTNDFPLRESRSPDSCNEIVRFDDKKSKDQNLLIIKELWDSLPKYEGNYGDCVVFSHDVWKVTGYSSLDKLKPSISNTKELLVHLADIYGMSAVNLERQVYDIPKGYESISGGGASRLVDTVAFTKLGFYSLIAAGSISDAGENARIIAAAKGYLIFSGCAIEVQLTNQDTRDVARDSLAAVGFITPEKFDGLICGVKNIDSDVKNIKTQMRQLTEKVDSGMSDIKDGMSGIENGMLAILRNIKDHQEKLGDDFESIVLSTVQERNNFTKEVQSWGMQHFLAWTENKGQCIIAIALKQSFQENPMLNKTIEDYINNPQTLKVRQWPNVLRSLVQEPTPFLIENGKWTKLVNLHHIDNQAWNNKRINMFPCCVKSHKLIHAMPLMPFNIKDVILKQLRSYHDWLEQRGRYIDAANDITINGIQY